MKKKGSKTENIITAVIVIAAIVVISVVAYWWYTATDGTWVLPKDTGNTEVPSEGTPDGEGDYIGEVRYIGGIGYPEVYDTPFQKNDFYVTNKELWEKHPEIPDRCVAAAETFTKELFTASARQITGDTTERIQKLKALMDNEWVYEEDNEGNGYLVEDYIEKWNDYVVDNNISMSGTFKTDSSLVCENGLIYVRGVLEYEVYSSDDKRLEVKDGIQNVMIEVLMHKSMTNREKYDVVGFEVVDKTNK